MGNDDLRDLLKSGYDTHAAQLRSGDDFAARHHGAVSRAVGRRRIVRQAAITGGALASVSALAVAGAAAVRATGDNVNPLAPSSTSSSPSPLVSPSPSPSPSTAGDPGESISSWVPTVPSGAPQGDVVEDDVLSLALDAQAPAAAATPPTSVSCGDPAGEFVAPIFVDASARILRPDTVYPTFLDPSYVPQPDDALLADGWWLDANGGVDPSAVITAGQFFVAVSTVDHAWTQEIGATADYTAISHQGALAEDSAAVFSTSDIDFLYGSVIAQDGVIVGHADFWSPDDAGAEGMSTALMTVNESSARRDQTEVVYDFGVGPLAHVLWCSGSAPAGPVDTYAVVGSRSPGVDAFDYSMLWAGAVEYK